MLSESCSTCVEENFKEDCSQATHFKETNRVREDHDPLEVMPLELSSCLLMPGRGFCLLCLTSRFRVLGWCLDRKEFIFFGILTYSFVHSAILRVTSSSQGWRYRVVSRQTVLREFTGRAGWSQTPHMGAVAVTEGCSPGGLPGGQAREAGEGVGVGDGGWLPAWGPGAGAKPSQSSVSDSTIPPPRGGGVQR